VANWREQLNANPSLAYTCAHCGSTVGAALSWEKRDQTSHAVVCPVCDAATVLIGDAQFPGTKFGGIVMGLPNDVSALYTEARDCMGVSACTATVLLCRKILMHVAVAAGADAGLKFVEYVQYLWDEHYVPPNAKGWVDHIREKGNEANHEITLMSREEAEQLMSFTQVLLQLVYELPQKVPGATQP
jgi:DNA-directed RNA polymerase subunit RPC12/RpoP